MAQPSSAEIIQQLETCAQIMMVSIPDLPSKKKFSLFLKHIFLFYRHNQIKFPIRIERMLKKYSFSFIKLKHHSICAGKYCKHLPINMFSFKLGAVSKRASFVISAHWAVKEVKHCSNICSNTSTHIQWTIMLWKSSCWWAVSCWNASWLMMLTSQSSKLL